MSDARAIVTHLRKSVFPSPVETVLQERVEAALALGGWQAQREVKLNERDRIDFLIDHTIGLEVKCRHGRRSTFRQLERYCQSGKLTNLILLTNTFMGLPPEIEGVPLYMVAINRSAL